jgi:hypothetical protein
MKFWNIKSLSYQKWERRRSFLLLVDACQILSATPEDTMFYQRRRSAARFEELYRFVLCSSNLRLLVDDNLNFDLTSTADIVFRTSLVAVFTTCGIVRSIAAFL